MIENLLLSTLICFNSTSYDISTQYERLNLMSNYCQTIALNEGINEPSSNLYSVKDLSNNIFYIQLGDENGFMVYEPVVSSFIEVSSTLTCPYDFFSNEDYYYFGPMNYYKRVNDTFYSLVYENETFNLDYAYELQNIFDKQLIKFRQENVDADSSLLISNTKTTVNSCYIKNYELIKYTKHPSNYDNSCGFVAASLILNYWDKTMHRGTVMDSYYDSNMDLINTEHVYNPSINLKDKLVELNGGIKESWGQTVKDALISYCEIANIEAYSNYYLLDFNVKSEILNNRPVIIFGELPNPSDNNNYFAHAVTCYGIVSTIHGDFYKVHYGWGNKFNEVTISSGFIGSVTTFKLNESKYETNYTIKPSDYGYPCSYCSARTTSTLNIDENKIISNRLRCGYIENEYINLSPRKEGYGTAYIEYSFTNPIKKLEMNLSYWSNDERYGGSNIAQIAFDYKDLTSDDWINKYDFLEANDLPKDRKNQKLYTFEFEKGTKNVRLYSNFDYMSGKTDRNKGRISIGDMNVYTYR